MQPKYFGDKRDLIKWSILFHLAETKKIKKILQIAYCRETLWPKIEIDKDVFEIPKETLSVFRNIYSVKSIPNHDIKIEIFGEKFSNRHAYQNSIMELMRNEKAPAIIFLDPDTGLQPPKSSATLKHVKNIEVRQIWEKMPPGFILVFYQHGNRSGKKWHKSKLQQFADAIKIEPSTVKIGSCNKLANDVVFFIIQK